MVLGHVTLTKSSTMPWHWLPAWGWVACHCCSSRKAYGFLRPKHFIIAQSTKLSWNQGTLHNPHWAMKRDHETESSKLFIVPKNKNHHHLQKFSEGLAGVVRLEWVLPKWLRKLPSPPTKNSLTNVKTTGIGRLHRISGVSKNRKKSFISRVNLRLFRPEHFHV